MRVRPSDLLERHRTEIREIASRHRASNVRVFGSVARGEDSAKSDIDLLVSFEDGASYIDLVGWNGLVVERARADSVAV